MNAFKNICTGVGFVVISLVGAMACLAISGNAKCVITNKRGEIIYDNSEKVKDKELRDFTI